jgi:two-component system phosphate regulon sensor histidine kinase PhoR
MSRLQSTSSLNVFLKRKLFVSGCVLLLILIVGNVVLISFELASIITTLSITTISLLLYWGLVFYITTILQQKISEPLNQIHTTLEEISGGASRNRIVLVNEKLTIEELSSVVNSINRLADKVTNDILDMKRLERVRSEFLGNVSHELRTPIFAIQGFLETLLDGALDDENVRHQFVERAFVNAERLSTLLTDLIDISRIESGEMKLSLRYFDVNEVINEVGATLSGLAEANNTTLNIITSNTQLDVLIDKERFSQVITNLLENAIKYNKPQGSVTLSAFAENGSVLVKIEDTGIGIPEEHIDRIFERFYRVDKDRSRSVGGSGLGLAIVKHIIEAHKATISVQSSYGIGTTFTIRLRR